MRTILVPTDFSENAVNVLNYAIELAKKEGAKIVLLHVFHLEPSPHYMDIAYESNLAEEKWMNKLRSLQTKVAHAGDIKTQLVTRMDLAVDGILAEAEERKADLIVMGTKGATGLKEVFMGSNASRVIEKANCPVLVVPEGAFYSHMKKITYATNYNKIDVEAVRQLLEIAVPFSAQVNLLHVYEGDEAEAKNEMTRFIREEGKKISYSNLSYELIKGEDVEKKLEEYLESGAADLMVVSTHKHDLRDRLFSSNTTKKLVCHAKVPVLAFHYKKKEEIMIV